MEDVSTTCLAICHAVLTECHLLDRKTQWCYSCVASLECSNGLDQHRRTVISPPSPRRSLQAPPPQHPTLTICQLQDDDGYDLARVRTTNKSTLVDYCGPTLRTYLAISRRQKHGVARVIVASILLQSLQQDWKHLDRESTRHKHKYKHKHRNILIGHGTSPTPPATRPRLP